MRVLIFHGYLLDGTGSNVYNARLAAALRALGHEVHLLCQDRHPREQPFVDAVGDWDTGELRVRTLRETGVGRCTVYRPNIGSLLPVYVADRYEGIEARTFANCTPTEVNAYIDANVAAIRDVLARAEPDLALANHIVMGPLILARALPRQVPYAVKVHGSALEYTVKPNPARFLPYARDGLAPARAILVGSRHTAQSLWRALADDPTLPARTRLGPPGVDVARFAPREPHAAAAGVRALAVRLLGGEQGGAGETSVAQGGVGEASGGQGYVGKAEVRETGVGGDGGGGETSVGEANAGETSAFARDVRAAGDALGRLDPERDRLVAFVGKLIAAKGVDLLLDAWPQVTAREPAARLVVVGFGSERARFETAAIPLGERVVFTGRLDHDELAELLPACEALVVPSTFPEAFGMVAAEAAACGVLPISAAHSGLAEVSRALARDLPPEVAPWLSFPIDNTNPGGAAEAIAARVLAWLHADTSLRARARAGLVQTVRERWSWEGVARGVIAAARGQLDALPLP